MFMSVGMRNKPWCPVRAVRLNVIGARRWDIASYEWKNCFIEIETVTFVIKGSAKLNPPPPDLIGKNTSAKAIRLCGI